MMSTLNRVASEAMRNVGANAATDVTGFGLAGHLHSMMVGSSASAHVRLSSLPVIDGVWDLLDRGVAPGAPIATWTASGKTWTGQTISPTTPSSWCAMPRPLGGLLMSVPADSADGMLGELESMGVEGACIIGHVTAKDAAPIHVTQ